LFHILLIHVIFTYFHKFMRIQTPVLTLFLFVFIHFSAPLSAQKLKSPEDFFPHKYGEQFTPHHLLVSYFEHVAQNSEWVQLKTYGKTNQNRPLTYAVISSKENLAKIEDIRLNNLRRAGVESGKADNSAPVSIVWLSMSVHGNEPAGSESSAALLYNLVNPDRADTKEWLKNTVVIIDPSVNPDGYHRYTHWYVNASDKTPNTLADAREHREPWPGGRVNHYLFDLNRDWAWCTQVESQQRIEVYKQWLPHIHADLHEMGYNSPYYFAPAAEPFHPYITPFQRSFQFDIGKNHTRYFDREGWLYFTREVFDLFYPSYGDTYPTYNGSVGMTYEQGGIGAGRAIGLDNGDVLTLKSRIAHHLATGLSTVEVSAKNAGKICENFADFFQKSAKNPPGAYKTFVVKGSNAKGKIESLCQLLDRHKIKYGKLAAKRTAPAAYEYTTGKSVGLNIGDDDLVISAHQPFGLLAQVLLEPVSELVDSNTYDITAWSLPYAYGLEAYALKEQISPTQEYNAKTFPMAVKPETRAYAYVATWKSLNNVRFAATLLQRGLKIRVAPEDFEMEGKKFERGSLLILRGDNPLSADRLDREVISTALLHNQEITPVSTGFADKGFDFGSGKLDLLQKPQVALIYDDDVDNNSYGQMWYFFEQDMNVNVTQVKLSDLNRVKLGTFNVICMTDGGYSNLDSGKLDKLRQWVSDGGRLILIGEALSAFEDKKGFELTRYASKKDRETAEEREDAQAVKRRFMHFDDYERDAISDGIPGAIFRMNLDNSHPLAYGMPNYYFSLKTSGAAYQPMKNVWNVGYTDDKFEPLGFVGYRLKPQLKNTVGFAVQSIRRGTVVYMVDNPLYRNFWYQGKMLMSNAVLMPLR
jgi:hypothetical protein